MEELLRRDPKRFEVYLLLGPLYERQERYKDALRTYERLERQETTSQLPAPIFAAMAGLHLQLENLKDAERYGKKGIAADANSWRSHYVLGNVYAVMNQPQKQIASYDNALKALDEILPATTDPSDLLSAREQIRNELEQLRK